MDVKNLSIQAGTFEVIGIIVLAVAVFNGLFQDIMLWIKMHLGQTIFDQQLDLMLPMSYSIDVNLNNFKKLRLLITPLNVGTQCLGGTIMTSDRDGSNQRIILELEEPESLLSGIVKDRAKKYWTKGTGSLRKPIIVELPRLLSNAEPSLLTLKLHWNFIDTRLENLIPKNKHAEIELMLIEV